MKTGTIPVPRHEQQLSLRIGGGFEAGGGEAIMVKDPTTGQRIAEVRSATFDQVSRAVAAARRSHDRGDLKDAAMRAACLTRLADIIESRAEEILPTIVAEVGTPVSTARNLHIETPVRMLRWLAEAALVDRTEYLGIDDGPPRNEAHVLYRPVGVVAAIAAYNYPLMFAAMKVGLAFAAGCPSILLSSPLAPLTILNFGSWVEEAGFPADSVSVLTGGVDIAQALIRDPSVAKVTFTGSVAAGESVMSAASAGLKGVVLELGGKSAAIVLPNALPGKVAPGIHSRYLRNAGQGCASPTRILVHRDMLDSFVSASQDYYATVTVGDPRDPDTLVGPVISEAHQLRVQGFIDRALEAGGCILAQGDTPTISSGWYVRPTLIGNLPNDSEINQEEIFGPVATVIPYEDIDEAISIANASKFGLHASIFGPETDAMALVERLDVGLITINGGGPTRTDAPNGGWKKSGIGRERGEAGIREFLEPVTVQRPVTP